MDSGDLVKQYHKHYALENFQSFSKNTENCYVLSLRLYILKEKLLECMQVKFEHFIQACKKSSTPVLPSLKELIRKKSHHHSQRPVLLPHVDRFVSDSQLCTWEKNWWCYARLYAKTECNIVAENAKDSDPMNVLHIFTSCTLFSDKVSSRALEVSRIRNIYEHLPVLQISTATLNNFLFALGQLELELRK